MLQSKNCKECGSPWHSAWYHKERKPLVAKRAMNRGTKRLRPESKKHKTNREATTAEFWKLNPPDTDGYWICYLQISPYCIRRMTKEQVNPEHVLSKTRHQDLRYVAANVKPACSFCNELKGSRDYINGKLT